ncbi:MAG: VWA domain-containing protein [Bacteroidia bacterium]|nr:VWA domain-containing protein [Bacteroidia bacterium]
MQGITVLYIIIAGIAALLVALFQYLYKTVKLSKRQIVLCFLRFCSVFGALLLLINPKFSSESFYTEKANLVLAVDNSKSILYLDKDDDVKMILNELKNDEALNDKFNISTFKFGTDLQELDSLQFSSRQSNISQTISKLSKLYTGIAPIVLISDGNQTVGTDYQYLKTKDNQPVYTLIAGDSTTYVDLSIAQLNVNRYAFLNNRFPIEVILNYNGSASIASKINIYRGNTILYSKAVSFSKEKTSEIIKTTLLANKVGVQPYRLELQPLENEKNTANNIKNFAVEVIDQKTNVALVSDISHPDLGAIKKAVESNQQRSLDILKPEKYSSQNKDYQLVILYQPNTNFNEVFNKVNQLKSNFWIITGTITDYSFLNNKQSAYKHIITNQTEDFVPVLNQGYSIFITDELEFQNYPPLTSEFGNLEFTVPHDILLYKTINGIETGQSLISTFEINEQRQALISGEGIWRWRAQCYIDSGSFEDFDAFIGKLVQYTSSKQQRRRLNIDYKSFYDGNDNIIISAQYFNQSFEFDPNESLTIRLTNTSTSKVQQYPLLLNNGYYDVDLSGIEPGNYSFVLSNNSRSVSASGSFEVLDFDIEQQFLNPAITKLQFLSENTNGSSYFLSNYNQIKNDLLSDTRFISIQKSSKNIVPLIDWKYLLLIIAVCLSAEWFIRKYNGLI